MSIAKGVPGRDGPQAGQKVVLLHGPRRLWKQVQTLWAGTNQERWRDIAMIQLVDHCGWTVVMAARAFGIHKGQASRRIYDCKRQLAELIEEIQHDGQAAEQLQDADELDAHLSPTDDD